MNQKSFLFILVKWFVFILFKRYHVANRTINHVILSGHKCSTSENEK